MSKIEANKWFDFSPSRRHFLWMLWWAALVPVTWVKNAISQVLDLEANEWARRDIIIALQPSYWGKSGYNTPQTLRRILTSMWKVRWDVVLENINILWVKEFQFFKWTNEQIADQILRVALSYQSEFLQVQKKDESADWWGQYEQNDWVDETYIRDITTRELDYMRVTELPVHKEFINQYWEKFRKTVREIASDVPDARVKTHFYWDYEWWNIRGSYINRNLWNYVWSEILKNISTNDTYIKVSVAWGRYYVALYMNSELKLLSYVSPWQNKKWRRTTDDTVLTKIVWENLIFNKYRMSWKYDESAMYLSIDIQNGELFHASKLWVDGTGRSHGCLRLPIFYIYGMNELLKRLPQWHKVIIDIDKLY
jgi:hypothetical protein